MAENITESGGFLPPSLPSPAPSGVSQSSSLSNLPHPRSHPLRSGSAKEETTRRYIETRLQHVERRYARKFIPPQNGLVQGYVSMTEVSKDLGEVVDVLWLSGTPSLQVPYLLTIALSVASYLPSFPAAPKATLKLLKKLDHAFSSLLKGEDSITGDILPGFESGSKKVMSRTDMVRVNSLVQSTRVIVVEAMSKEIEDEPRSPSSEHSDTDMDEIYGDIEKYVDEDDMGIATVYADTITVLGDLLQTGVLPGSGSGHR